MIEILVIAGIGMIMLIFYLLFLHELVSIVIGSTVCRKKRSCQNRRCVFCTDCSKYSAPKPDYPPRKYGL